MLGLSITDILLHIANLTVLLCIVYFGLYKKIKLYMKRRSDEYQAREDQIAETRAEADRLKESYQSLMERAGENAEKIKAEIKADAETMSKDIIDAAEKTASSIIKATEEDMKAEKAKLKAEFKNEAADIVVTLTERLLERELKSGSADNVIEHGLSEWVKG